MEACSCYENSDKVNCIINNPSDFARDNMIYLQEIGEQQQLSPYNSETEKDLYLFFLVMDGQGKLEYENITYTMAAGHCVLLDCQKSYCYYPIDGEMTVKYIYYAGFHMKEIYQEYIGNGGVPCFRSYGPKVYIQEWEKIYAIAAAGIKISSSTKSGRTEEVVSSFSIAKDMEMYTSLISLTTNLIKLGKHARVPARRSLEKRNVQDVKEYLEKNYPEKISLDSLSEIFFINKFYLIRLFREQFGTSVNDYLIQVRLSHAKSLLSSSKMSVREISDVCGFKNTNYFYKIFRKREGISPGEFQKLSRK